MGAERAPGSEALACLAGEGLIERRRGRGYFYPTLTAADVIDLFELQLAYLHGALTLNSRGLAPLRKAVAGIDALDGVQAVFHAMIAQSDNAALTLAHRRLSHRPGAVLRTERRTGDGAGETAAAMVKAVVEGQIPTGRHRVRPKPSIRAT